MATGASNCRPRHHPGRRAQGRAAADQAPRHHLLAARHPQSIVLAVNKIDLVGYDKAVFDRIVGDFTAFAVQLGFTAIVPIPVSARFGDNVVETSRQHGLVLRADPDRAPGDASTSNLDARSSRLPLPGAVGQPAEPRLPRLLRHGRLRARARRASRSWSPPPAAPRPSPASSPPTATSTRPRRGDAVTLTLADEVDIARGDVLVPPDARPDVADQFAAHVIWMIDEPLLARPPVPDADRHALRAGHRHHDQAQARRRAPGAARRQHARAERDRRPATSRPPTPVAFDPYAENRGDRRLHPDRPLHQRRRRRPA